MRWWVIKVLGTRKKKYKQFTLRTWAIHTPHTEYLLHYDELPFNDARASACLISQISLHLALSTSSLCQMLCAPIISVNSRCNFYFYHAGVLRISSCTALGCALKWRGRLRGGGTVKLDGYRAGTPTKTHFMLSRRIYHQDLYTHGLCLIKKKSSLFFFFFFIIY